MKIKTMLSVALMTVCLAAVAKKEKQALFPDGTPIPAWFNDTAKVDVSQLGKRYVITDYGVKRDSNLVQTEQIQAVIDRAAKDGGGVVVIGTTLIPLLSTLF